MNDTIAKHAFHLVMQHSTHGEKKKYKEQSDKIHSISTEKQYIIAVEEFLKWRKSMGLSIHGPYLKNEKIEYLIMMSEIYEQTRLNTIKQALQLVFQERLDCIKSEHQTTYTTRSYEANQVTEIMNFQTDQNALSSLICYVSGTRDHELLTIRRLDEQPPTKQRKWLDILFSGMPDYVIYTVIGKGGLCRQIAIPIRVSIELEKYRLEKPVKVTDRGIFYNSYYAIGGGQAFSQSFSDAAKKAIGYSTGSHGLRHSYAKRRLNELLNHSNLFFDQALLILSQELGHFRPDITLVYLR